MVLTSHQWRIRSQGRPALATLKYYEVLFTEKGFWMYFDQNFQVKRVKLSCYKTKIVHEK